MLRQNILAAFLCLALPSAVHAQGPSAAPDTTDPAMRNIVNIYAMKSGRLMLSSTANPGPVTFPDGTYTNESGTIIVFLDGSITRLQRGERITEVSNMRLNRQKLLILTPSTNALMTVSDITLPSGIYKSPDESTWLKIVVGRPAEFVIGAAPSKQ